MRQLSVDQLTAKVADQRADLTRINAEHAIAARVLKEKRNAALRAASK